MELLLHFSLVMSTQTLRVERLINNALAFEKNSKAYRLAEYYKKRLDSGKKLSGTQLFELAYEVGVTAADLQSSANNSVNVNNTNSNIHIERKNANSKFQNGFKNDIMTTRGERYVRTDEFRRLQAEGKGMSDEDIQLYHSGKREVDEELRKNISELSLFSFACAIL